MTLLQIQSFVQALAEFDNSVDCFNPYTQPEAQHNLQRYLEKQAQLPSKTALIFEAPGYRGARITGIPLTSQKVLRTDPFYADLALRTISGKVPHSEATATIVHEILGELRVRPLLWNAFPFHPHRPGDPRSNRKPRVGELAVGGRFLRELLELFAIERVVAVGNSAETILKKLHIPHQKVRHPSFGGKTAFSEGLLEIFPPRNSAPPRTSATPLLNNN